MQIEEKRMNYLQRGVVHLAVLVLLAAIGVGGVTTVASQGSVPGDILYPVNETFPLPAVLPLWLAPELFLILQPTPIVAFPN